MRRIAVVVALVLSGAAPVGAQESEAVHGTVTDELGLPLEGVCVALYGSRLGTEPEVVRTGPDGRYELSDSGGSHLSFNECEDPRPGYAAEWWPNALGSKDAEPVSSRADAALSPAATISGSVKAESDASPLGDICVSAADDDTGALLRTRTAADGTYALANLPSGSYVVIFVDCSASERHVAEVYDGVQPLADPDGQPPTRRVSVVAGTTTAGIDAALELGGTIEGIVTLRHAGFRANSGCVSAYRPGDDRVATAAVITRSGYLLGVLPPGEYQVAFFGPPCTPIYTSEWFDDVVERSGATTILLEPGGKVPADAAMRMPPIEPPVSCPHSRFPDWPLGSIHAYAIDCVVDFGLAKGRADGTYGPAEPVRRDQMASFVARALNRLENLAGPLLTDYPGDAFGDDQGNVHEHAINQLAELGMVRGRAPRRFEPTALVTRAEMATLLVSLYELPMALDLTADPDLFPDDDGNAHEPNIDAAATAGMVVGTDAGTFEPAGAVKRDQMASFLIRAVLRVESDFGYETVHGDPVPVPPQLPDGRSPHSGPPY